VKAVILYDGVADGWSDKDVSAVLETVARVAEVLRGAGHSAQRIPVRPGLRWLAPCRRADVVVNLCEGVGAVTRAESLVAGTLELAGVPFTGVRPEVLVTCLRKPMANALLSARGIPVPTSCLRCGSCSRTCRARRPSRSPTPPWVAMLGALVVLIKRQPLGHSQPAARAVR
jgi:D-alanine-D-alanine ligase-like ATP-grasp enzyme